jgi:hypothetical protein
LIKPRLERLWFPLTAKNGGLVLPLLRFLPGNMKPLVAKESTSGELASMNCLYSTFSALSIVGTGVISKEACPFDSELILKFHKQLLTGTSLVLTLSSEIMIPAKTNGEYLQVFIR